MSVVADSLGMVVVRSLAVVAVGTPFLALLALALVGADSLESVRWIVE